MECLCALHSMQAFEPAVPSSAESPSASGLCVLSTSAITPCPTAVIRVNAALPCIGSTHRLVRHTLCCAWEEGVRNRRNGEHLPFIYRSIIPPTRDAAEGA